MEIKAGRISKAFLGAAITIIGLYFVGCSSQKTALKPTQPAENQTPEVQKPILQKVKLELYGMSQCPFCAEAEGTIAPLLKKFGDSVEFKLNFIGDIKDDKFSSMHGDKEVNGDKVQLCAIKQAPDKYMDMIVCMNRDVGGIPDNWESCAAEVGIPIEQIKNCYSGEEGANLLKSSFEGSNARNVRGSPTIFINDKPYNGSRSENSFIRTICNEYEKDKPALCESVPPAVVVPITILTDQRCKECNAEFFKTRLEQTIPSAKVEIIDWRSAEGKKLYTDLKLTYLPAVIMGKEILKADEYNRFQRGLEPRGDFFELRTGSKFDPNKEICDNDIDDNNNGLKDCDDPDCKDSILCRPEIPKKLDVFVMSQCPYAIVALDAVKEVLDNFKGKVKFDIHYIASVDGSGELSSMHGPAEVDEDVRQMCVMKYYRKGYKFMDYVLCRNKNIRDDNWKSCAKNTGIDAKKIDMCSKNGEGKKLLLQDIKMSQALGINGSPTWLANNKKTFSGIDAETIKSQFCNSNLEMKGCGNKLSGPKSAQSPNGGCAGPR